MSRSHGGRFSTTYGMAAPYTPMLAPLHLLFETPQQLFVAPLMLSIDLNLSSIRPAFVSPF